MFLEIEVIIVETELESWKWTAASQPRNIPAHVELNHSSTCNHKLN